MSAGEGARTYTFLYTDIVGSSRLWEADPHAMASAVESHNLLIETIVEEHRGRVFKSLGDGLACVFESADSAVRSGVAIQRALASADLACPISVRVGIHSGTAHSVGRDFGGPVLNRVSRITDLAEGGQIFVSQAAQSLAQDYVGLEIRFDALGEVILEGMSRSETVFCVRADGLRGGEFFGGDNASLPPSNLEGLSHPFIGRVSERKDLVKRLHDADQRLITVVGFGGMGKTTLARQCGLDVREDFAGCAYWVECEPIRSRDELAAAALSVLGEVSETADSEESLVALIGDNRVLLIFDCFENIVTLGGFMDRLVRRCPNLKVLVTSRIVLGAEAEYLVELGGMSGKQSASVESDAVELFLSHTARHSPAFGTKQAERTLVRRLVRYLEYVPLAIVICAGRLRYTPIKALHEQIQSSLLGTVKSVRDQAGRHSGLARVIQMSFDLLDEVDQRVLEGLSVFEGGFTLESACAVLEPAFSGVEASIYRLRDHSFLAMSDGKRFSLLDSIREFLCEGRPKSAVDRIEKSFVSHFLLLAQSIRDHSAVQDWASASELWRAESVNLRTAARLARADKRAAQLYGKALARVLLEMGLYSDLGEILTPAIEMARQVNDRHSEIELLGFWGISLRRSNQPHLAVKVFDTRTSLSRELGSPDLIVDSLCDTAMAWLQLGNVTQSESFIQEAMRVQVQSRETEVSVNALMTLVCAKSGDPARARSFGSIAEAGSEHEPATTFFVGRVLGEAYRAIGDFEESVRVLTKSLKASIDAQYAAVAGATLLELALTQYAMRKPSLGDLAMASAQTIPLRIAPSLHREIKRQLVLRQEVIKGFNLAGAQAQLRGLTWVAAAKEALAAAKS